MARTAEVKRPDPLKLVPYAQARESIQLLDLGLVSGDSFLARQIQRWTNGPYSHAMTFGWCLNVLMVAESTSPESRVVTASSQVKASPGRIDVYRLRPEILALVDVSKAWEWLLRASGVDYPEIELVRDWRQIVLGEGGHHWPNSDEPDGVRRVCSGLVHACWRVHGVPPIVERDCDAYPPTLADPGLVSYLFTLTT